MRNPLSKALWSIGLAALGVGLILLAVVIHDRGSPTIAMILGVIGLNLVVIFLFTFFWALFSAIGYTRLMSGKHVIARWHVSPGDWDRLRANDQIRAAEHLWLRNDMRIRNETPAEGVEVIVGHGGIIVDGSYHSISGRSNNGRRMNWLNAPVDPECIEFPKTYSRGKSDSMELTLRVPVPASARAEGVRVFEFYRPKVQK